MKGAILGDIIGSVHERAGTKSTDFALFGDDASFTDDTVLTVATAHALLTDGDFECLELARASAEVTHNHPHGIAGAQATALGVFLLRHGADKATLRAELTQRFGYDLSRTVDDIRPTYEFDVTCQGSVPEAIIAFLDSDSVESAIRLAISLGGDADTQAAVAGALAEAAYGGVPDTLWSNARPRLSDPMAIITDTFVKRYGVP